MSSDRKHEQYGLLGSEDEEFGEHSLHDDILTDNDRLRKTQALVRWKIGAITCLAVISHALAFCLGTQITNLPTVGLSPYLRLNYSQRETLWWNTEYSAENASEAELNRLWDATIPWESGIIALSNDEAAMMDLPDSQPFPWDAKRKKIYIVNAHHLLHCVRNIYISIHQYRTNQTQTIAYQHILHCLDSLRVETMCTADDTPRYVPLNSANGAYRPGDGQPRQCRDWGKVQAFVETHDPCYQYLRPGDPDQSNLERFGFCPQDSEYLPKIRKYFGYDDTWIPKPREGPREIEW